MPAPKTPQTTAKQKLHELWASSSLLSAGVGLFLGLIISQFSQRYALALTSALVWVLLTIELVRLGFFDRSNRAWKISGNVGVSLFLALALCGVNYASFKFLPASKEPPTIDQQIDAFAKRFPWIANPPQSIDQTKQAIKVSPVPKLKISLTAGKKDERTLILDNKNGDSDLTDFEVNGLGYYLDKKEAVNNQARVESHYILPGPLNFRPFAVAKGTTTRIDLSGGRYGFAIRMYRPQDERLRSFDDMWHYICLRLKFTQESTGEIWVHYVVMSPSGDLFLLAEQPEHTGTSGKIEQGGQQGWPYTISRAIKADAREYYGTEFREYAP